ncbi:MULTISPECIES: ABC transporter permease [Actinoallomurus]|uniref:ABC transporter permease n=1 Tax=Actinoallomurus TaxID=667113 RepID=UPI0020930131|nr:MULTISPECIES: ABC transporter permease [Actinoallomurus]MCO5970177.1 ABC transporter permease [Actinoallomurus soli]MCO5995089.1 ABC transporter permease [Actinoallomurus rhizosphaericola]
MSLTELAADAIPADEEPSGRKIQGRSPFRLAMARLMHDKMAVASVVVLVLIILFAIGAPLFASWTGHPYGAQYPDLARDSWGLPKGPSKDFWLGADPLGRDVLVRAAYGARISLFVGIAASILATVIGVTVGVLAGYIGGAVDAILARFMDVVLSFPYLLVAIVIATTFRPHSTWLSLLLTITVIAIFSFAAMARIVRGQVISLKEKEFIEAARSLGAGRVRIMFVDILPNLVAPVTVLASLLVPTSIVFEATLSFLGVGIQPPMPSWGSMLNDADYRSSLWLLFVPGGLLLLTTLAFNLLGDGIRDAFDPRSERLITRK